MMLSESKTLNATVGAVGTAVGIVCLAVTVMVFRAPFQKPDVASVATAARDRCEAATKAMGMANSRDDKKNVMVASIFGTDAFEGKLARASYVIKECGNYKLDSFCMGQNCPAQNGQMITGVSIQMTTLLDFGS